MERDTSRRAASKTGDRGKHTRNASSHPHIRSSSSGKPQGHPALPHCSIRGQSGQGGTSLPGLLLLYRQIGPERERARGKSPASFCLDQHCC